MYMYLKGVIPSLENALVMLLFFFLLLSPKLAPATAERCHPDDKTAILNFKNSFSNGPELLPMWTPDRDFCDIFDCDETTNRITSFSLSSDLSGTIPDAIGDLTYLRTLRLHKMPYLVGEIPRAITKLKYITFLDISWTNVSGHVPPFLAEIQSVKILDLSFNNLSGPIPPSLATLPNIIGIDLSRNRLTGPIPESFGHLATPALQALSLSHNLLSGQIPLSLGNMKIYRIDLSRNNFSGDASMLFGESKGTSEIDISRNKFEFDFSGVGFMAESLVTLDLSHNKIYGKIPSRIVEALVLQHLNVSYNRLCGEIPSGWKLRYRSEGFDNSSFVHNRCLCGAPLATCK